MTPAQPLNFLFATMDGGGNVAPTLAVVAALAARGSRVRVMSDAVNRQDAEDAGADFTAWTRGPSRTVRSRETDAPDWMVPTALEGLQLVSEHFMGGAAAPYAEDLTEALDEEPADLVVTLDMLMGVMAACEARGQPFGLLNTYISTFPMPGVPPFGAGLAPPTTDEERARHEVIALQTQAALDAGLGVLNIARANLGLAPLPHLADQARAARRLWLGTARAFDFAPAVLPERVRYVGPLIADPKWAGSWTSPWAADDPRPLVLVGFSTSFQNHAGVLQRVIDAAAGLPVRLLVTLGGSIEPHELTPAANTAIVASAPHTQVMAEAALVVTHGGHGTVMAALMSRLPMLVIPHGRDQGDNAVRVTERGAGLSLAPSASTDEIHAALERLLGEPRFQASARRLGDAVAAEVHGSTLIDELEALARSAPEPPRRHRPALDSAAGAGPFTAL